MGIDVQALRFLEYAAKKRPSFGSVATLGRQGLHITEHRLRRMLPLPPSYRHEPYAEALMMAHFGATSVASFDASDFEQATFVVDMNKPLPPGLVTYDTIIDAGCLEHIFNAPQALRNISGLCKPGAQILHILPANNQCGHGFWQFSPELFFSLYSEENGYRATEVFLSEEDNEETWYEVSRPKDGARATMASSAPISVLCRTEVGTAFSHEHVQQSDYVYAWRNGLDSIEKHPTGFLADLKGVVKRSRFAGTAYDVYDKLGGLARASLRTDLARGNPSLIRRSVKSLL